MSRNANTADKLPMGDFFGWKHHPFADTIPMDSGISFRPIGTANIFKPSNGFCITVRV